METTLFSQLVQCTIAALSPLNIVIMFAGLVIGIIGGMVPGITIVTTIALCVPFTFSMPIDAAFIMLGAIFAGGTYGGANASILINVPGQPSSFVTTIDGYQMTLNGQAEEALYGALLASAFGGIFGAVALLLFFEPLSTIALQFGSEAFFWLAILGLTTLAGMFKGATLKSLMAGAIGLALSTIGLDRASGMPRFTFGYYPLVQGLDMVVMMISLFSISQILHLIESEGEYIAKYDHKPGIFSRTGKYLASHCKWILTLGSLIGTVVGALPGAGGSIAAIIAYNEAKRWDKKAADYGKGVVEGVAAPESANNGSVGGALVPMMALGIPGSPAAALIAGGLMAQGLIPGPTMFETNGNVAYTFIISFIIANIGMIPAGYVLARICTKILAVPKYFIIAGVISLGVIGAFSLRGSMFDVFVMLFSGGLAYLCNKARIAPVSIGLGLVLGPIIEEALTTTMMRAKTMDSVADLLIFTPMSGTLMAISVLAVIMPLFIGKNSAFRSYSFSSIRFFAANFKRLDIWLTVAFMVAAAVLLKECENITGSGRIFPEWVLWSIIIIGALVCLTEACAPVKQGKPLTGRVKACIAVHFCLSLACYFVIPVLGFYASLLVCMVLMLAYSYFIFLKESCSVKRLIQIVAFAIGMTVLQYLCFSKLLNVTVSQGLLF